MKEWLLQNLDASVIVSALTVLGSAVASIISLVKTAKVKKALEKARKSEYWTKCPVCHSKIGLIELTFYRKDGVKDDDLDGEEDKV